MLCHLGVPRIEAAAWSLRVDGLVESSLTLGYDDLLRYPKSEIAAVHQCCGSPFAPFAPSRRVCNIVWAGARLAHVLADSRPRPEACYVWSRGADFGEFGGVLIDAFGKDLEIARVNADVLIAYEMNGRPLAPEHGFPARLLVPGFYGTNSVKWLTSITLAEGRMSGLFTTRWYSDPVLDLLGDETNKTTPVWSIAPDAVIVSPAPQESIELGREKEVWGWTWADGGVGHVSIRISDEPEWLTAELEPPQGREWQRFSLVWTPRHRGPTLLTSRAQALTGARQPIAGRRNEIHSVALNVL